MLILIRTAARHQRCRSLSSAGLYGSNIPHQRTLATCHPSLFSNNTRKLLNDKSTNKPLLDPATAPPVQQLLFGERLERSKSQAAAGSDPYIAEPALRLDLRVGLIKHAELVPNTESLIKLSVDLGEANADSEPRTIVAGLAKYYTPDQMVNRRVVVVSNLAPSKLAGIKSEGMLLAATPVNDAAGPMTSSSSSPSSSPSESSNNNNNSNDDDNVGINNSDAGTKSADQQATESRSLPQQQQRRPPPPAVVELLEPIVTAQPGDRVLAQDVDYSVCGPNTKLKIKHFEKAAQLLTTNSQLECVYRGKPLRTLDGSPVLVKTLIGAHIG
ncbi:nucleic acid-binding protein [Ramicandelaber brevisporus]|nr:nucleic acid-binding protein [Ramicandelaber brevisporus]